MATTYKDLVPPVQLGTGTTTQYTAPAGTRALIVAATLTNTTGSAVTGVSIYLVPSGGSAGASRAIYSGKTVAVSADPLVLDGLIGKTLEPGGTIQTIAGTGSALTFQVSGVEFT